MIVQGEHWEYSDTASRVCPSKHALTRMIWSNITSVPAECGQTNRQTQSDYTGANLFFLSCHRDLRTSTDDMQYEDLEEKKVL